MWYSWSDLTKFTAWHNVACTTLGIPHPNFNEAAGEIDINAQWTTTYTSAVATATDVRAFVEDYVAQLVPDGLGVPCEKPDNLETN